MTLRENISSEVHESTTTGPEAVQITVYLADEYTIITPWREGLEEAVNGNTAAWLDVAKNTERTQLTKEAREYRNKLLADIDWTQTIDAPISAASREALRNHRGSGLPVQHRLAGASRHRKGRPGPGGRGRRCAAGR